MALTDIFGWNKQDKAQTGTACGTACGAADLPDAESLRLREISDVPGWNERDPRLVPQARQL